MAVVLYEKKGKIAYITLNRPEKLNAVNEDIVEGLQKAWIDFRDDDELWVAILAANGRAFCAGADVASDVEPSMTAPLRTGPPPGVLRTTSKALRIAPTSYEIWKPVICAVHGYVYGAGAWLALTADIRIAAEGTLLGAPEAKVGRAVNFASLATRYLPMGIANELLLLGDSITADRAYQLGLFNMVVPAEELMPAATRVAERMCENSPIAVRKTKEVMLKSEEITSYEGKMALAEAMFLQVTASEDAREGAAAFKGKRKPVWKGK